VNLPAGFAYRPGYLKPGGAERLLSRLNEDLQWRQYPIRLFGRDLLQPRLTAWCSDPGVAYCYSGVKLDPAGWHPEVDQLRCQLMAELGVRFNSVLINAYRDGQDAMGWHADDEPELGDEPSIASVSLGQTRVLRIRPRGGGPSQGIVLEHGSLLVMSGPSQAQWQHAIPRSRRPMGLRINLTFRKILAP
jgi:alkylated DNA repair dioxygenase AlkB